MKLPSTDSLDVLEESGLEESIQSSKLSGDTASTPSEEGASQNKDSAALEVSSSESSSCDEYGFPKWKNDEAGSNGSGKKGD